MITQNFINTHIHITGISDTAFTLGEPTPNSNGVDYLKDGQTYSYITNNGASFEEGVGVFTAATRQLGRAISYSSATDNSPIPWPIDTVLRITVPPLMGSNNSGNGGNSGSDIKVLDSLGDSATSAISQRAATDAVNARVATIDADAGIASMQLDDNGNIVVTDKKGGNHTIVINSISGDAQTPDDTLYSITNYYVAKDGSLIARDSNGKLWSVPDKDYVTKAIADAGGGSTNTTYATTDLKNVTDGTFQARKLSTQQIIDALGFTPLGSDADLSKYAEKDLSNVSAQTIQSLEFVSKQITDALGYVPAKQIDANGLALTDLSNVSIDTFNKKLNFPVSGEDPTVASGGANNNNKGIRNLYVKVRDKTDTSQGSITGGIEYILWALTNSSYGTESSHKIQILTREQVEYLIKNGGGSSVALVQDINGTSTTAAPSQNAVKVGTINAGKNPATASISGWNSDAAAQSIYRILYRTSVAHASTEKYGVRVYGDPNESVVIDLASIAYLQQYAQPKGTYLTSSNIVQTTGDSTTNVLSQKAIADNYALKTSAKAPIDNLNGNSTTAAPTQNAVATNCIMGNTKDRNIAIDGHTLVTGSIGWAFLGTDNGTGKNPCLLVRDLGVTNASKDGWHRIPICPTLSGDYGIGASVIDNLSGTSTTAAPSQNSVKVAIADLQSKIDALTSRVSTLEAKG